MSNNSSPSGVGQTNSENTSNVQVNVTASNTNPLSDLSTSQPEYRESIRNNLSALGISESPFCDVADNRDARRESPATTPNKRVIVIRKGDKHCDNCNGNHYTNQCRKRSDTSNTSKGNTKQEPASEKKLQCKSCGKAHNSSKCIYNKSMKKNNLKKVIDKTRYWDFTSVQNQEPKVSVKPVDPQPSGDDPNDDPIFDINWAQEFDNQLSFTYVQENHSLPFYRKVYNWWNSLPNVQKDSLPRSLMIFCQHSLGHGRSTIHYVTYTSKVFESELWRQWSVFFMDNDMMDQMSRVKLSITHFFFHDMSSFEKYLPLFRANEPYSASMNVSRPILDSKQLFTALHTPWIFLRRWISRLCALAMFSANVLHFYKMYQEIKLMISVVRLRPKDVMINMLKNFVVLLLINYIGNKARDIMIGNYAEKILVNRQYDMTQLTLVKTCPEVSVVCEELIKCVPGGWRLIGWLEKIKYGTWDNYHWHKESMKYGFSERLKKHQQMNSLLLKIQENMFTKDYQTPSVYTEWLDDINRSVEHDIDVSRVDHVEVYSHEVMILPSRYPKIPKGEEYYSKVLRRATGKASAGTQTKHCDIIDHNSYEGYFPIFYNVGHFKKPAPSFDNLLGAWHKRALDIPNSVMFAHARTNLPKVLDSMLRCQILMNDHTREEWFKELKPIQRNRILKVSIEEALGTQDTSISVSVKSDELLCTTEKMVPRLIFNVSGFWLDKLGPFASELSHEVAKLYGHEHKNPINYRAMCFYPYFTCGATSESLNKFYNDSFGVEAYHLMVMGDDLHVYDGYHHRFIENDFSKFDRSQNFELQGLFVEWLRMNGYTHIADLMGDMWRSELKPKCRKINPIKIRPPPPHKWVMEMMFTGQPFTCLQNSIINILTTIYVLSSSHAWQRVNRVTDLEIKNRYTDRYLFCGLTAKVLLPEINRSTFLKGVFLDGVWTRLPSFLTKFGKIMTRPSLITKKPNGMAQILIAQWLGYGDMKNNWFYRKLHSLFWSIAMYNGYTGSIGDIDLEITKLVSKDMEYSVSSSKANYVSDETFNSFMFARYGVTVELMEDYCDFLRNNHRLPMIYTHKLVLILEKDY